MFLLLYFSMLIIFGNADEDGKVFGGVFAQNGEFPSVVAILGKIRCGGTIVVLDKVLTAGHCMADVMTGVPKPIKEYTICGGSVETPKRSYKPKGIQLRKISEVKFHEKFRVVKGAYAYHDVALIILDKPFVQTETLAPAKLPSKNENGFMEAWMATVTSKKKCIGVGWGTTRYFNEVQPIDPSNLLKAVELTTLDPKMCIRHRRKDGGYMKGEVCARSNTNKNESICIGDSGSPLFCDGYAFALVSSVKRCGYKAGLTTYFLFGPYLDYFGLIRHVEENSHMSLLPSLLLIFIISSLLIFHPWCH